MLLKLSHNLAFNELANYLIIAASLALQWYACSCGPGLTSDSWQYLEASQSLAQHGILIDAKDLTLKYWPPLFPMILSLLHPHQTSILPYLNMGLLTSTLFIFYYLIKHLIVDRKLQSACLLAIGIGLPTIIIHVFLWSETLFLCLLSLLLLVLFKGYQNWRPIHWVILVLVSSLLCLQRYSGIFLTIGLALGMLCADFSIKRGVKVSAYLILSLLPIAMWMLFAQPTSLVHLQQTTFFTRNLIFHYFVDVGLAWFIPHSMITNFSKILVIGMACILAFILLQRFRAWTRLPQFHKTAVVIIVTYFILLNSLRFPLVEATVNYSLLMDVERFMSVIYPASMLLLFYGVDKFTQRISRKWIIYVLLAIWLCYPLARSLKNVNQWHRNRCAQSTSILHG